MGLFVQKLESLFFDQLLFHLFNVRTIALQNVVYQKWRKVWVVELSWKMHYVLGCMNDFCGEGV